MSETTTTLIHFIDGATDESHGVCGAPVKDFTPGMPMSEWDWTEDAGFNGENITCLPCREEWESMNEPCCGACANEAMGITEGGIAVR